MPPRSSTFPSTEDIQLLFELKAKLPGLRKNVELARLIGRYPRAGECSNAALAFGFTHAIPAIIESQLLRMAEAVDPFLDQASQAVLGKSLFIGEGRNKRPQNDELHLLLELRSKRVAHRVKLREEGDEVLEEVKRRHGDIYRFLLVINDLIGSILDELNQAGLFAHASSWVTVSSIPRDFTLEDLDRLLDAANSVARN